MMRTHWRKLSFVVLLGGAVTAGAGCGGDDHQGAGTGGQSGTAAVARPGRRAAVAGLRAAAPRAAHRGHERVRRTSTGGSATGTGGGVEQSSQQIHDALLNAPTAGGVNVTRTPPTATYPTCR